MQNHRHATFIVATANDLSTLPPELMRKDRFDEFFFVDLPSEGTRAQVLAYSPRTSQPRSVKVQPACSRQ
jgi:SpoVK/Ycf46/Vps4 family AAA+-type ATPase